MCTAITYRTKDFYFGRTLDYDCSYGEEVSITPRNYPFQFCRMGRVETHYAMIGMAHVADGYPLYYEAVNEKGLGMAGLNFVGNACFRAAASGWDNVAPYEFIPWVLGQCATVKEVRTRLQKLRLVDVPFSSRLPVAKLHWIIADRDAAIVVESLEEGIKVYDDPAGVLTNDPPFDKQMFQLNNYMGLSPYQPENRFSGKLPLQAYSRGMGAFGLPGDVSSQSRFVRAAFVRANAVSGESEAESVSQFFHILGSVEVARGVCRMGNGKCQTTLYTCCCNASRGAYYYTTYQNRQIASVEMQREDLNGTRLICYPLAREERIFRQN